MELKMNHRVIDGESQINCLGYFKSDWFSLDDLISKQEAIYSFIKELEKDKSNADDMIKHYDVTEHMRVELLKYK